MWQVDSGKTTFASRPSVELNNVYRDVLIGLSPIDGPISHELERQDEVSDASTQGTLGEAPGEPQVIAGSQRAARTFSHVKAQLVPAQPTTSHFQQRESLHQFRPPLYDSSGYINHQSPASVSYLDLSLSSSTVDTAQHNHHMSGQGISWLPSTADSSNPASFFTYDNPLTRSLTQALTQTQTMAFNVPLDTGVAFSNSDVEVMHDRSSQAASQAHSWNDNSASSVSSFEYSNWAGAGWTSQLDREHSKTSQLRQDQTGSRMWSQALFPQPQPQPRREEQAQLPLSLIEPLDPRQHQSQQPQRLEFNQNNMQISSSPSTTSECVFFRPFTSRFRAYLQTG